MTAEEFLQKLTEPEFGAIASTGDCSEIEIANARATGRLYVNDEGFGFVLRSRDWLNSREQAFAKGNIQRSCTY